MSSSRSWSLLPSWDDGIASSGSPVTFSAYSLSQLERELDLAAFTKLVQKSEPHVEHTEERIKMRFTALKAAGSGRVRVGTYVRDYLREMICSSGARTIDVFRSLDTDRSGEISRDEFHAGLKTMGLDAPKADVDAVFDGFDTDRSGSISYEEIEALERPRRALMQKDCSVAQFFASQSIVAAVILVLAGLYDFGSPRKNAAFRLVYTLTFLTCGSVCWLNLWFRERPWHTFPVDFLTAYCHVAGLHANIYWRRMASQKDPHFLR